MTFEMWLRADALGQHQLIGKWGESSNQEYRLLIAGARSGVALRDQSTGGMATVLTSQPAGAGRGVASPRGDLRRPRRGDGGQRHHDLHRRRGDAALPHQRSGIRGDGNRWPHRSRSAREGAFWNQFNGGLDDLRIWSVARTQSQIQAAMSSELTGAEPGLVALLALQRGRGPFGVDDSPSTTRRRSPTVRRGSRAVRWHPT